MVLRIVALSLLCTICSTAMGFTSRTESQVEVVALRDGRHIKVERTVQWTTQFKILDPFFGLPIRPRFEKSDPDTFSLKFKHPDTQEMVTWQGEQHYTPVLLNIVSGVPYLVVNGVISKETEAIYGCPELPYFYLKYESGFFGKWMPVPAGKAPDVLRISNLSQASRNDGGFFQRVIPRTYEEWDYIYKDNHLKERKVWDCRLPYKAPPPTKEFVEANKLNEISENNANVVDAIIVTNTTIPEEITKDAHRKIKGEWTGTGYLADYCIGTVKNIKPLQQYSDRGGAKLILNNSNEFPIRTPNLVTCANDAIYAISRDPFKGELLFFRYSYSGKLIDTTRINLPNSAQHLSFNHGGDLWEVIVDKNDVAITIADYVYSSTANLGGTVNQKIIYSAKLPTNNRERTTFPERSPKAR